MAHKSDNWFIQNTHNTARFFTENRHIAWMVLIATFVWGVFGYFNMPQRKDPDIPVRVAVAICSWPGVATEKVEQLVTRKIEEKMAENITVKKIESTTRVGVAFVYVTLQDNVEETGKQFDDIKLKLDDLQSSLPDGAGPVNFIKDFGSTAALMLTVASPKIGEVEISLRAKSVQRAIEHARAQMSTNGAARTAIIYWFPPSVEHDLAKRRFKAFVRLAQNEGVLREYKGKNLAIAPTGEFKSEKEIGGVIVGASPNGLPVYLRDLVEINRSYDSPPRFMNFYTWRDEQGNWQRLRALPTSLCKWRRTSSCS